MRSAGRVRLLLGALSLLLLGACGDPPLELDVPPRPAGVHLLDEVGLLDPAIDRELREVSEATGFDVVGLVFEDERTTMGQAYRGARLLLREWEADIVLVAVAAPGDFESAAADRSRFFGVDATDRFEVTRDLRERIIYERVQLLVADNEWGAAFTAALDELEQELVAAAER